MALIIYRTRGNGFVIAGKAKNVFPLIAELAEIEEKRAERERRGLCPDCGAHLINWIESFGEEHSCNGRQN